LGKTVVCDRYIFDTVVVDVADDFDYTTDESLALIRWFLRWFPTPDQTILLDVPESVSMERKDDIPDIEYLHSRRERYLRFADAFTVPVVDGTAPISDVVDEVVERHRQ
jgi:dTMP kinase